MTDTIKELIAEFHEFFDATSEYGIGYLDALCEVCQREDIKHTRTVDSLFLD